MTEIFEQLELNQTIFLQFALFAVCFLILKKIYLKPFQALIEKRNIRLKKDSQAAAELLKTVEIKLADYEKRLQEMRAQARSNYESAVLEIKNAENTAIANHRETIKKDYQALSQKLLIEKAQVELELKTQVSTFADHIVEKALSHQ